MRISLRYFASLRETIGVAGESLETDCEDVGCLRQRLIARGGAYALGLDSGRPVRVAVNQVMAQDQTALSAGCEVAFFPPVTGG